MSPIPLDRRDRTLAEQLSAAFVALGWLVAGAFFVTALAFGVNRTWLTAQFEESRQAVATEAAAYTAMIDEEDGTRAYLLTRDVRFLEPYLRGELERTAANRTLSGYEGTVAKFSGLMLRTRMAEERWRERWGEAVVDTRPGALMPTMLDGKALFDDYRLEHAAFVASLTARRDRLGQREQYLVAVRVALELSVFIAVLILAVRQHRALRLAIVDPVAELLRHIRRVRDGKLEATLDPGGPRELRQLGEGLNEMVRALSAAREAAASRDGALSQHSIRLHQILDASREFSESLNLSYVVGSVRESTLAIGGYERVLVWLMDDEQRRLVNSEQSDISEIPGDPLQGLAGRAAKSGRTTFEGPAGQIRFSDSNTMAVRAIAIPLIVGARVVGVLEARHVEPQFPTKEVLEVLEMLATHAATAIESARLHEVIEERSHVDALTRLLNRRRLDEDLEAECKRCLRYSRPLSFVMLDVDHFKAFNDAHGHPQADTALQEVANVIATSVRATDTAYRYGGEEFCILLRETNAEDAMHFAERLRKRIEQRFVADGILGITASFGVADFSTGAPTARALVEAADAAMYESKNAGRNRVALSLGKPFVPSAALVPAES